MTRHSLIVLALTLLFGGGVSWAGPMDTMGVARPAESLPAPDFALPSLNGGEQSLGQFRGKVVLLHFWATWCTPCRKEMPVLHKFWQEFQNQGLELVSVNVDRGSRKPVEAFLEEVKLPFRTLLDPDGEVRNTYEVFAMPTTYIIGRDGRIIGRIIGERDWSGNKAQSLVRDLLAREKG